jgi:membrane-associated phospholipid phosphatase
MVLTTLAKVAAYACPPAPDLHSPTGHASPGTLYGAVTLITATETDGFWRIVSIIGGIGLICGIAASRVLLAIHSPREVGVGLVIGIISLVIFVHGYLRDGPAGSRLVWYLSSFGILILAFHGSRWQAEPLFRTIPWYLRAYCN